MEPLGRARRGTPSFDMVAIDVDENNMLYMLHSRGVHFLFLPRSTLSERRSLQLCQCCKSSCVQLPNINAMEKNEHKVL